MGEIVKRDQDDDELVTEADKKRMERGAVIFAGGWVRPWRPSKKKPPKARAVAPLTHDERWARMDKLAAGVK